MKKHLAFTLLVLLIAGCGGNQGSTNVNNSESGTQAKITIGKLVNGQSLIEMPINVFGSLDTDAEGAVIDIAVNGTTRFYDLNAAPFYHSDDQEVRIVLTALINGDQLQFTVHKVTSRTDVYRGTVSGDAESYAYNESGDLTALSDSEALSTGSDSLAARDLVTAQQAYCNTFDNGSTDSSVAFGCFLSTSLILGEDNKMDTLLAMFNEDPIDVDGEILDAVFGTYSDSSATSTSYARKHLTGFRYAEHPSMPLYSVFYDEEEIGSDLAELVYQLNLTGTTAAELQDQVESFTEDFEYLESTLETVLADTSFSFTIPQELFNSEDDLTVSYNDARFCQSGVKGSIVSLNVFTAYDWGITFSKVLNRTGDDFDYEVLTADLNGENRVVNGITVDANVFMTLEDESKITDSETRFQESLELLSTALHAIEDGEESDFIEGNSLADEFAEATDDVLTSLDTDTMVSLNSLQDLHYNDGIYDSPVTAINAKEFFTNPPSSTDVTTSDPFVYNEEDDKIEIVESYFRTLLGNVVQF